MKHISIIIVNQCRGSEDGLRIKVYKPSPTPVLVVEHLAKVFIDNGWAKLPHKEVEPKIKKVVNPGNLKGVKSGSSKKRN